VGLTVLDLDRTTADRSEGMAALQAPKRYDLGCSICEPPLWQSKEGPLTGSGGPEIVRRLYQQAGVR